MSTSNASVPQNRVGRPEETIAVQERLRRQLDFTRTITKSLGEGVIAINVDGRLTFMNPAAERMLGWTGGELLGRLVHDTLHRKLPDGTPVSRSECSICVESRLSTTTYSEDDSFVRRDGTSFPIAYTSAPILDSDRVTGAVIAFRDLTDQKVAEQEREKLLDLQRRAREEAEAAQDRLHAVIDVSPVPMAILDRDGNVRTWNLASEGTFGWTRSEAAGNPPPQVPNGVDQPFHDLLLAARKDQRPPRTAIRGRHKSGSDLELLVSLAPLHDSHGELDGFVMVTDDVTEQKRVEQALEYQAMHDSLTSLPNRLLLRDRLDQAVRGAQRERETFALLFMDLDHFKEVNDTYGHHVGDRLLEQVGRRLRTVLRDSDTVARLGGDEFAILLRSTDTNGAILTAEKLLTTLIPRVRVDGHELPVGGSLGIAIFPDHAGSAVGLMQRADIAMYAAKRGQLGIAVYSAPNMDGGAKRVG